MPQPLMIGGKIYQISNILSPPIQCLSYSTRVLNPLHFHSFMIQRLHTKHNHKTEVKINHGRRSRQRQVSKQHLPFRGAGRRNPPFPCSIPQHLRPHTSTLQNFSKRVFNNPNNPHPLLPLPPSWKYSTDPIIQPLLLIKYNPPITVSPETNRSASRYM